MNLPSLLKHFSPILCVLLVGSALSFVAQHFVSEDMRQKKLTELETLISSFTIRLQDEVHLENAELATLSTTIGIYPEIINAPDFEALINRIMSDTPALSKLMVVTPLENHEPGSIEIPASVSAHPYYRSIYQYPTTTEATAGTAILTSFHPLGGNEDNPSPGYLVAKTNVERAFAGILTGLIPPWLDIIVYTNGEKGANPFYYHSPQGKGLAQAPADPRQVSNPFAVYLPRSVSFKDNDLSLLYLPNNNSYFNSFGPTHWLPLQAGLVVTLIFGIYLHTLLRRKEDVERLVKTRTQELDQAYNSLNRESEKRRQVLEQLTESESQLSGVINSVDGMFWEKDLLSQRITYVSEQVTNLLGYSVLQVLNDPNLLSSRLLPEHLELVREKRGSVKPETQKYQLEMQIRRSDDRLIWIRNIITPVFENGQFVKERGVTLDISHEKELEEEHDQLSMQLRQAQKLEAIGQLAAGIAHEINTPTQFVGDNIRYLEDAFDDLKGLYDLYGQLIKNLSEGNSTDENLKQIEQLEQEIDLPFLFKDIPASITQSLEGTTRIRDIVKAMKEFSHPGSSDKEHVDLNHAIESTITVARNEWKYIAEMETNFAEGLPTVAVLPGEFNQVILNMIVNAAHAIADQQSKRDSTRKGVITISSQQQGDHAIIKISDTGAGISKENLERIFDPFFTTKEVGKGTGQGLAIAYSVIVDKHDGQISVDSTPGEGTTFSIKLPIDNAAGFEPEDLKIAANS